MALPDIQTSSPDYQPGNVSEAVASVGSLPSPLDPGAPPKPIDLLPPGSELHSKVLGKLLSRLKASEDKMSQFHKRWQVNERRFMAYVNRQDFEKLLEESNKKGETPSVISITVPYVYATVWTVVTYLIHAFCGQKPIFQIGSYSKEAVEPARKMETVLQFNADKGKLVEKIFQWMMDGQIYGLGVVRNLWTVESKLKSVQTSGSPLGSAAPDLLASSSLTQKQPYVCYEGNEVTNIDPYMFFPDPRVPMTEVNRRGEYVFWRSFEGLHTLQKAQASGLLSYIDSIGTPGGAAKDNTSGSVRDKLTDGDATPGSARTTSSLQAYHQLDQGTIELVPADWGLSEETDVQKWIFTIANKTQIIQAEEFSDDHGRHPICAIEPNSVGYGFGQTGIVDMLGPIQDVLSWFVNSHMFNVRSVLNNMIVFDPAFVEAQDLKTPGPGKLIRLKPSAMGRDVRTMVTQLQVGDVTGNHISDMQAFIRIGDMMSGVNDALRGQQPAGGRRSATESRLTTESGASRLAALARRISAQGLTDLAEQQTSNVQQYQSMEFYLKIVGSEGALVPINPGDVAGDFYFPVHDGTLPLDRVALLDVWKEIWMAVSTNPQLAAQYNGPAIFEYMGELAGAKNLSQFRIQIASPGTEMPNDGIQVNAGLPGTRPPSGPPAAPGQNGSAPKALPFQ